MTAAGGKRIYIRIGSSPIHGRWRQMVGAIGAMMSGDLERGEP
jgi:hypothetical protein